MGKYNMAINTDLTDKQHIVTVSEDGSKAESEMDLLHEHALTIVVNEQRLMRLICTKQNLHELVLGRLLTDGLIEGMQDVSKLWFCKYENEATVLLSRELKLTEDIREDLTCCTGNRVYFAQEEKTFRKLPECRWEPEWIFALAAEFSKGTELHDRTGSTHSCILARNGEVLFVCEDIGRHNAVDKAVGYGLKNGVPLTECMLYTSGRVPVDMAEKVIAAGVPVLVSKSLPTAEAVSLAHEYGLTLIGNAHRDSMRLF